MSQDFESMPPMPPPEPAATGPVGPPPACVNNAVWLMFVRVVISAVGVVLLFVSTGPLRKAIEKAKPDYDSDKVDHFVRTAQVSGAVIGIIILVLYILLALQVRKGKNWARIVTWIIAAIGVIDALASLGQTATAVTRVIGIIGGLIDVAIIVLLLLADANRYFAKPRV